MLLSLPCLGAGHFLRGRPGRGLIFNFFFWLLILKILLPRGIFPGAFSLSFGVEIVGVIGASFGLLALYLIGMLNMTSMEEE